MSTDDTRDERGGRPNDGSAKRVRTSDAEREVVAETLRNAVTEGRLSLEEGDQRLGALYATKFRDELPLLTADLPAADGSDRWNGGQPSAAGQTPGGQAPGGPGWGPGWAGPPWGGPGRGIPGGNGPGRGGPPGGRGGWRAFRVARVAIIILIIGTLLTVGGGHFFWPIIPLFFLTMAVARILMFSFGARHLGGTCGRGPWQGGQGYGPGGYGPGNYGQGGYGPGNYGQGGYGPGGSTGFGPGGFNAGQGPGSAGAPSDRPGGPA